jgi:hypothetical protein
MWTCKVCSTANEANFDACWSCGTERSDEMVAASGEITVNPENGSEKTGKAGEEDFDIDIKALQASAVRRFLNGLIDLAAIIVLMYLLLSASGDEIVFVFTPLITILYYVIFESISGATIGKILTRTRVVNIVGDRPGVLTSLVRTICRFIPFDQLTFITPGAVWHDNLSRTFVVYLGHV